MKKLGLLIKKWYIQLRWKGALKQWLNHNPELLHKLAKQLNKTNYELRQIRSSKKIL